MSFTIISDVLRLVTGACFVVFNANLKEAATSAKSSIVEDGLMAQIQPETMLQLRCALRDMRNFVIEYGGQTPAEPRECFNIEWVEPDTEINSG